MVIKRKKWYHQYRAALKMALERRTVLMVRRGTETGGFFRMETTRLAAFAGSGQAPSNNALKLQTLAGVSKICPFPVSFAP